LDNLQRIPVRRVVTGHDPGGKAIFSSDGQPPVVFEVSIKGTWFTELWRTQPAPALIDNGADPTEGPRNLRPPKQGTAIRIVQIAPEKDSPVPNDPEFMKAMFSGLGSPHASTTTKQSLHPLMHRTETIDYGIILEGEVTLILDDSETTLRQGDIVVQRGTNHAWSNRGDKPCRIVFVLIDGTYSDEISGRLTE
jgi:hypothetical protein